jgi:hypothetical protein
MSNKSVLIRIQLLFGCQFALRKLLTSVEASEIFSPDKMSTNVELKEKIKDHYNKISSYYKDLWGDNIHHGFWIKGDESKEVAQEQLMQELAKVGGGNLDLIVFSLSNFFLH